MDNQEAITSTIANLYPEKVQGGKYIVPQFVYDFLDSSMVEKYNEEEDKIELVHEFDMTKFVVE